jgi:hypothetical protein
MSKLQISLYFLQTFLHFLQIFHAKNTKVNRYKSYTPTILPRLKKVKRKRREESIHTFFLFFFEQII